MGRSGLLLAAWSVLPVAAMVIGLRWLDPDRPESVVQLLDAFVVGLAVAAVAVAVNQHFALLPAAWLFLLVVGPGEEGLKLMATRWSSQANFDEPSDGLLYGMAVGAGFAAIENLAHAVAGGEVLGRLLLTTPAHMLWSGIAGHHLARSQWLGDDGALVKGFLAAAVLHGVYDVLVHAGHVAVAAVGVAVAAIWAERLRHWRPTRTAMPSANRTKRAMAR